MVGRHEYVLQYVENKIAELRKKRLVATGPGEGLISFIKAVQEENM